MQFSYHSDFNETTNPKDSNVYRRLILQCLFDPFQGRIDVV